MLDPDVRRVLDGTSIAHLATILPGGVPHAVPIWTGTRAIITGPGYRKTRNMQRDPRVALSLAPADRPVIIRGRVVDWLEGDAEHRLNRVPDYPSARPTTSSAAACTCARCSGPSKDSA
jgi:hypothetical protein